MRRITAALLLATMVLVSCGDEADNAAATTTESTSTTTDSPAPNTSGNTTTAQPTTTTTTQAPTTTQPTTTAQALATTTTDVTVAGDDTADIASEVPEVVDRYVEAVMDGDASALAALFTDDGVMTGVVESRQRSPMSPPSVIRGMMGIWFAFVDYTDVEHKYVIAEGNTVVVVSIWSGTSSTHGRGGADPTPFSAPVVEVLRLEDGLIRSADAYFEYDQIVN